MANKLVDIYKSEELKIKAKLKIAIEHGNDTKYLTKILLEIQREIKKIDKAYKDDAELKDEYKEQTKIIDKEMTKYGITANFGKPNPQAIGIISKNMDKSADLVTLYVGRKSKDFLRRLGLKGTKGIVFGSDTWKQASKQMLSDLNKKDFFFVPYKTKSGKIRKVPSQVYTEMVSRTTSKEVMRLATIERIKSNGYDLVKVIGNSNFSKSPCVPYQGKTLSISGKTEGYTSYETAKANGLFHPNCIHTLGFSEDNLKNIANGT